MGWMMSKVLEQLRPPQRRPRQSSLWRSTEIRAREYTESEEYGVLHDARFTLFFHYCLHLRAVSCGCRKVADRLTCKPCSPSYSSFKASLTSLCCLTMLRPLNWGEETSIA